MRKLLMLVAAAAGLIGCGPVVTDDGRVAPSPVPAARERVNPDLAAAEALVAGSDRYLHQSKLTRGMKGFGLTIMAGTKVERFDATVVSVLRDWYPHQDVILCKLSGLGLESSGIISGMSGSPVFFTDPADGKAKMVGAVAYGWNFQKEPIAGIQPISQMLAIGGTPLPGRKPAPPVTASAADTLDENFVRIVLDPRKVLFADRLAPVRRGRGAASGAGGLAPVATPVMISGAGDRTLALAETFFKANGMMAVRAGTVSAASAARNADATLVPGGGISIPLVAGDADWAAIGTVTEVIGDYVLAFGHSFNAEGAIDMPMGPAYIHTVIPSTYSSFKMGSTLKVTGAVTSDEYTAIGGRIGRTPKVTPLTCICDWGAGRQKYTYRIVRHRRYTAAMAYQMLVQSAYANRNLPVRHTVEYQVNIDFGKLGEYRAANISSGNGLYELASDIDRPISALLNSGLGPPIPPERIDVALKIRPVQTTATILNLELERNTYRPGQTVRGQVTLRPFRAQRVTRPVAIDLPDDLRDGEYTLTVCDAESLLSARQSDRPHLYRPKTIAELFEGLQRVVTPRQDKLYVHFQLPTGGLAVKKTELEAMPASMAELLSRAAPMDSVRYRNRAVAEAKTPYVVSGSARASFQVRKHPNRTTE